MDDNTAAEYWGSKYFDASFHRSEWQAHPHSLERLAKLQGNLMRDEWFVAKYLLGKPVQRAIGIGVGRAETELELLRKGYVRHYDLYDISPVGLQHAQDTADSFGMGDRITTHCADVTKVDLPTESYDLVTFVASLHHMGPLEETLLAANKALKRDGILWAANEYVGPDRFGYPDEHLRLPRAFFRGLSARFRRHRLAELPLPTTEEVEQADPTEAPCSSLIIPVMQRIFPGTEILQLYGSFAFMVFWGLDWDALYEDEAGADLVKLILNMDQALVDCGVLPGYFAHLVARKTTGPGLSAAEVDIPLQTHRAVMQKMRGWLGKRI